VFEPVLNESFIRLEARWEFARAAPKVKGPEATGKYSRPYLETALYGVGEDGKLSFWSFTSDGKTSHGALTDVADVHKEAIGFEAQMPAGLARMVYWPDDSDGFFWVVESKTAKGWRRFTEHHYLRT
jgi:hypothetical protein